MFPLKTAADKALKEFNEASIEEQNFMPLMLPFTIDAVVERKPRRMYITWKKILDIGPTLECKGCSLESRHHKKECVQRFLDHYGEDPVEEQQLPQPPALADDSPPPQQSAGQHQPSSSRSSRAPANTAQRSPCNNNDASTFCPSCLERNPACVCSTNSPKAPPKAQPKKVKAKPLPTKQQPPQQQLQRLIKLSLRP